MRITHPTRDWDLDEQLETVQLSLDLRNIQDLLKKNRRAFIRCINKITRLQAIIQSEERKIAAYLKKEKQLLELLNQS